MTFTLSLAAAAVLIVVAAALYQFLLSVVMDALMERFHPSTPVDNSGSSGGEN